MGPSKLEKAKSLGIEIIGEDDFLTMIGLKD
jgi:BRCT domain type II-containing protein